MTDTAGDFRAAIPPNQYKRVFAQDMCDIDYGFLGFTDVYEHLAAIIPEYWTVVDLGCAYAPQAFIFRGHKAYIGVDSGTPIAGRFAAENTRHHHCSIRDFLASHAADYDQKTTFAICSYVPPWGDDNMRLAREGFKNVFTYYPAGGSDPAHFSVVCREGRLT